MSDGRFRLDRRAGCALTVALSLLFAVATLVLGHGAALASDELCVNCHLSTADDRLRAPAVQGPVSVHGIASIGCTGCHGGDPSDPTARAHATEAGFLGKPSGERGLRLCGECHADTRFVRSINAALPTDELQQFRASRHGELVVAGDPAAPDCIHCHGSHDIVPCADPRSVVSTPGVAELCGRCHADAQKMAGFRLPPTGLAQWRRSAHALAMQKGTPKAPTCTACHDAHRTSSDQRSVAAQSCRGCHEAEQQAIAQGVHAEPFRKQGFSECVPCHDAHDAPPGLPLGLALGPKGMCARCHPPGDKAESTMVGLREQLRLDENRAAAARSEATKATQAGLTVAAPLLRELDQAEAELRPLVHRAELDALEAASGRVFQAAEAVERAAKAAARRRRLVRGGALGAATLLGLGLVLLVRKALALTARARARRRAPR
jgi:hypothetical protein